MARLARGMRGGAALAVAAVLGLGACLTAPPPTLPPSSPLRALRGHSHTVTSLAVTPAADVLVSGSRDGTVRVWRLASGRVERVLDAGRWRFATWAVAISPDGSRLAATNDDLSIRVWSLAGGAPLAAFPAHADSIRALAWSVDGRRLASGSRDGDAALWSADDWRALGRLAHGNTVRAVGFSADDRWLFTGTADDVVGVWDVATGRLVRFLVGHDNSVQALARSADGRTLASGSADRTVRLWNARTLEPLAVLGLDRTREPVTRAEQYRLDPGPEVLALAMTRDGRLLASAHRNSAVRLWDVEARRLIGEIRSPAETTYALAFSPDGTRLFSGGDDDVIYEWRAPDNPGVAPGS